MYLCSFKLDIGYHCSYDERGLLSRVRSDLGDFCELRKEHTHTQHTRHPLARCTHELWSSTSEHTFQCPSSSMTTIQRKRKHEQSHPPRAPTYFFIGRQRHPPYAWAYDDNEMRASNIMWIVDRVIDDEDLEKVYLEEIAFTKSRGAKMPRREVKGGRKRRKGLSGGIIDLSISDSGEDEDHMDVVGNGRRESKFSQTNTGRSVESPSTSSINSSTSIPQPTSSQHTPTKRRPSISAVEFKRSPELRGVFVGSITGLLSLANDLVSEEGRQVDSICDGKALVVI